MLGSCGGGDNPVPGAQTCSELQRTAEAEFNAMIDDGAPDQEIIDYIGQVHAQADSLREDALAINELDQATRCESVRFVYEVFEDVLVMSSSG